MHDYRQIRFAEVLIMLDANPLSWLLAAGVLALTLWVSLRHLLAALGLECFDVGVFGGPEDLEPNGQDEIYGDLHSQLVALGFQPAGQSWESALARPRTLACVFLHPTETCRASLSRLCGGDYRAYFLTDFADGGAVLTANYSRSVWSGPNYLARGTPTRSLAWLLEEHRRDVAPFVEAGCVPRRCAGLQDVPEAKRRYRRHPAVRRHFRAVERINFRRKAVRVGVLPVCYVAWVLWGGWLPAAAWFAAFLRSVGQMVAEKRSLRERLRQMTAEQQQVCPPHLG
jgi:hypothetical protein